MTTTTQNGLDIVRTIRPGQCFLLRNKYEQVIHFRLDHVNPEHTNDAGKRFYFLHNVDSGCRFPNCYSENDLREYFPVSL